MHTLYIRGSLSHTCTHTHAHTLYPRLSLTRTHTCTHSVSEALSLTRTHTHAHTLYPRLSLSHAHTHMHTLCIRGSLSHTHTHIGDFYLTRHSNLSQVHIAFHLVTDEVAVQSSSLRSRHPVVAGLKNCLRAAARHDVHHITIPLLLVHRMQPVCVCVCVCVCAQWCMHVC